VLTDKDVQRLELGGIPVGDQENAPARLRHADDLAQRLRLIRNQHHTE